jgi:hypothetical protein
MRRPFIGHSEGNLFHAKTGGEQRSGALQAHFRDKLPQTHPKTLADVPLQAAQGIPAIPGEHFQVIIGLHSFGRPILQVERIATMTQLWERVLDLEHDSNEAVTYSAKAMPQLPERVMLEAVINQAQRREPLDGVKWKFVRRVVGPSIRNADFQKSISTQPARCSTVHRFIFLLFVSVSHEGSFPAASALRSRVDAL